VETEIAELAEQVKWLKAVVTSLVLAVALLAIMVFIAFATDLDDRLGKRNKDRDAVVKKCDKR
jgi:predicted Kef-type K+ transport protein